jgi:RNA polymerase II subunit A small phosphatase-like protein
MPYATHVSVALALVLVLVALLIVWRCHRSLAAERHSGRTLLVLDLDETLVFARAGPVVLRPHVHEFLDAVSAEFDEVAVFTAGTREYAEPIIDALGIVGRRLYRDACTPVAGGAYAKDLRRLVSERDLARTLLVDNMPVSYSLQPWCGVPIVGFDGTDSDDRALMDVLAQLRKQLHRWRGVV